MGCRPGNAQGERTRLAADQVGEAGKPFADRLRDQVNGTRMRLAAGTTCADDGLQARGSLADHALRPGIEAAARAVARKLDHLELFGIAGRAAAARLEQLQRPLEAGNARRKLAAWPSVELRHVPRAQNVAADTLVNRALDAGG